MKPTREYSKKWGVVILVSFVVISLTLTYLTAYTKYIFAKEYTFYIEAPCDSETMTCFTRDCEDYCPPNGLSEYRAYTIKASVFSSCTDNSCTNICQNSETAMQCEEIVCSEEDGDSCSKPIE
jgi:hypothetical protein